MKRIALFGGSFNPPGRHHRDVVELVARHFDEVIIIPCGPRPDKPTTNDVAPIYRANLVDLAFAGIKNARVELFDLEEENFTRTHELERRFSSLGEIWHVIGADLVLGGNLGNSQIQQSWTNGRDLWQNSSFVVIERGGEAIDRSHCPPNHILLHAVSSGSSREIRNRLFNHEPVDSLLTPTVLDYIQRRNLYRGAAPTIRAISTLRSTEYAYYADEENSEAAKFLGTVTASLSDPELRLVCGGDGTMLRAIRKHWRSRIPFYGLNYGHYGFLLNQKTCIPKIGDSLVYQHLPLLYVEAEDITGRVHTGYAFNDTWVERVTGQAAWLELRIDGKTRIERLVSDGALISTAAGCTSYAHAMGSPLVPYDTPVLLLVGSNVFRPAGWKSAAIPLTSIVEMKTLDEKKRPLRAYVDGTLLGEVRSLRARMSRIASIELVFQANLSTSEKLIQLQFPEA